VTPDPDTLPQLVPDGTVPPYYTGLLLYLGLNLAGHFYRLTTIAVDWRKKASLAGQLLAARILTEVPDGDPCSIVAHSAGGLVARWAWSLLVGLGEQAKVRRIVTLGTPHWGLYRPVEVFSLTGEILEQLSAGFFIRQVNTPYAGIYSKKELCKVFATFPHAYEIMPVVGAPGSDGDLVRPALYDEGAWPAGRGITRAWLDHARTVFHPWLKSAASQPPAEVLTCVVGYGSPTCSGFLDTDDIGDGEELYFNADGDCTVSVESAYLSPGIEVRTRARHMDMPNELAISGELASLVLDVRNPPVPPTPRVIIPGPAAPMWAGPPFAFPLYPKPGDC
jgi:hypothetical protein